MPIKKIEAGRVITQTIDTFIGIEGTIFYDEQTGELRLSDGETPGGFSIGGGGSGYILPKASATRLGGIKVGNELSINSTGTLDVVLSAVGQAIVPNLDAEYSIGTPELRWKDIYVSTGSVYIGDLKLSNDSGTLLLGSATKSDVDPHTIFRGELDVNDYVSISIRNLNTGTLASTDIILYQGGSEGEHFADFGIASDNYVYPGYSNIEAGDTYLIGTGGNVKIGTRTTGTDIVFFAGGSDSSNNEIARFKDGQGLVLKSNITFADGSTMSTAASGSGYTGSQGIIGYTGSAGIDGTIGYNGSDGYTGSQGDIGYTGSTGDVGYTGSQGNIGYTGSQGDVGYTGSKGTDGTSVVIVGSVLTSNDLDISYAGATGDGYITQDTGHLWVWSGTLWADAGAIKGPTGDTGYTGSQGEIGYTGSTGTQGLVGYTGSTGTQGVIGYTGSTGTQGITGYTGSTGTQGVIGYTGSTGTQGLVGYTGSTGTQGVIGYTGSTGTQGVIGYTGSQGDIGYTGSQGDIGYTGSTGTQGLVGYTGSQGDIGSTGTQGVIGYTGSQGDIGYTGSTGDLGYTGSKGNDGTSVKIVGNVTSYINLNPSYTGDIGDGYLAQDTGHLWIWTGTWTDVGEIRGPQGIIGYTGSIGVTGYTGSAGADGIIGYNGSDGYTGSQGYTGSAGPGADQDLNTTSSVTFANVTLATNGAITFGNGASQTNRAPRMIVDQDFIDALDYDAFFASLLAGDFYWSVTYSQIKVLVDYGGYLDWQDLTVYAS